MKIKNLLAITALVGLGVSAQATTITFLENGQNLALGPSSTFTEGSASLTAYGNPQGANLYAKNLGSGEQGLGLTSDLSGQHEISGGNFIQLLSGTGAGQFDVQSLLMNSTTGGEVANFYYSAVLGTLGTLIGSVNSNTSFAILSQYQNGYIGIAAGSGNVLLSTATGVENTVPDGGSTVALLGLALTGVGLIRRKLQA
jgi:hypothetical protein